MAGITIATLIGGDNKRIVADTNNYTDTSIIAAGSPLHVSVLGSDVTVEGGDDKDTIFSSGEKALISAGAGDDYIDNSGAFSSIYGGSGNDTLKHSGRNNTGQIAATLTGGSGTDVFIYGNQNADIVITDFSSSDIDILQIDDGKVSSIETIGNDIIVGIGDSRHISLNGAKSSPLHFRSSDGDTVISAESGVPITTGDNADNISSSGSSVTINAGDGANHVNVSGKGSSITSGTGNDHINISAADVTVSPGAGNDQVTLGSNNLYYYTSGDDVISNFQNTSTIDLSGTTNTYYSSLSTSNISVSGDDVTFKFADNDSITFNNALSKTINFKSGGGMTGFVVSSATDITKIDYITSSNSVSSFSFDTDNNYIIVEKDAVNIQPGGGNDTITFNHTADDKGSTINHNTNGTELVKGFISKDRVSLPGGDYTLGAAVSGSDLKILSGSNLKTITLSNVKDETVRAIRGGDQVLTAYNGTVTLTGSSGKDIFYYSSGAGNQLIKDYSDVGGNSDIIATSTDVQVSAAAIKSNDVVLTIGSNTLTIDNGKGKEIEINGYGPQEYGTDKIEITSDKADYATINTALNASVVTVDASARNSTIYLVGNAKNNVIVGAKQSSTLNGGDGNDTLTGSGIKDKFIYTSGKDVITNFVGWAKWDSVVSSSSNASLSSLLIGGGISTGTAYSISGSDVVFNIDKDNTLTIKNARNRHIQLVSDTDVTKEISDKVYRADTDLIVTNDDIATLYATYKDSSATKLASGVYIPTVSADSVKLIDANLEYDSTVSLFLLGNSVADSIIASKTGNDTLFGGTAKTADTLYGNEATVSSGGKNYFQNYFLYQNNAGNDVIVNYHDSEGDVIYFLNTDTTIASSSLATKTGDVTFTITNLKGGNKTTLKVANGQNKRITFLNPSDSDTGFISQVFGNTDITISNDDLATVNTKVNTNVKNITVSNDRSSAVYVVGNSKANSIVAGNGAEATLQGGTGNDTLVGGTQKTTFAFNKTDGTGNRIEKFKFGTDAIQVLSGALSATATVKNSSDITFTIGKTKVRVEGARGKKVTVVDTNGLKSTQTYGEQLLTLTNDDISDGATVNTAANSLVVTINAEAVNSNKAYIVGNKKANYIMAGTSNETIATAAGKDTVKVTYHNNQNIIVTDYVAGTDKIELAKGATIVAADTLASGAKFGASAADTVAADSVILTLKGGNGNTDTSTLVVQGTIKTSKKGVKSYGKITVIDDNKGITYAQAYGGSSIAVANGDGETVDARGNNNVVTINAKSRSKAAYIIGNDNLANSIYGGKKGDTVLASSKGGTIFGAGGADLLIADESNNNVVSLSGGAGNDTIKATFGANTLTGGKGNDVFFFDIKKADTSEAVITDIGTGSNTLYLDTGTHLIDAAMSGSSDVIVTLQGSGSINKTVKLLGANGKKVTVVDVSNKTTAKQVLATNTLTVVNADGDTIDASTGYNANNVEIVNAKKRSKSVMLIANSKGNTLIGGSKADTLKSASGNDYLTGGKGNDVFMVGYGGADTISDYSLTKNNTDSIQLASGTLSSYSVSGKNVILNLGNGNTVTVINGKDKKLAFLGADGKATTTTVAGTDGIFNDYNELILKKANSQPSAISGQGSLDSRVTLIDASANTQATTILANNIASTIKGSKYGDSISGGSAGDLITTGKGKDTIVMSAGNDTVTDYTAGTDVVALASGVSLQSAEYVNGTSLKLNATNSGSLLILNAVKKGTDQKITVLEGNTLTRQVYGRTSLTLAASDGSVLNLRRAVNSAVTTVDGSKLSAKNPITIYAGTQGGKITGGKGNDTFDLTVSGRSNKVDLVTSAGTDKVTGFKSTDQIVLASGHKINSATKSSSATEYTLDIKNSKNKVVGTLDISGEAAAFKTSSNTEITKTTVDKKTKATTTTTTTSYYVEVGGQKAVYSTTSTNTTVNPTTTKTYEERLESELFEDNNISAADDLSNITNNLTANSTDNLNLTDSLTDSFKPDTTALTSNKRDDK